MRPPKNAWPTSEEGRFVLLFAQLFDEMLDEFTYESFRVYSLDTLSRLDEALALLDDVQRGRIPRDALKPVFEEMLWSFDKDPIAARVASAQIAVLADMVKSHGLLSDLSAAIRLIKRLLAGQYKSALEEHLLSLFAEPRRKIELRQAGGFYCTHLINVGFVIRPAILALTQFWCSSYSAPINLA
jgi:hypothetical protein